MKMLGTLATVMLMSACGPNEIPIDGGNNGSQTVESSTSHSTTCSSSSSGNSLTCISGQVIPLPPTFPYSTQCNQCLTTIVNNVASVDCPNGLGFTFPIVAGATGAAGAAGSSCSVTTDGWVKCTDGTSYKLLQGPIGATGAQGATGATGAAGGSCSVSTNSLNQVVIKCADGSSEVLSNQCGEGGCWSFGSIGNVYTLPTSTSVIPDFSTMTAQEQVSVTNFDVLNQSDTSGFPGDPSRTTYFGIQFTGYIEVPACASNVCFFRLSSDDGSNLYIDNVLAVNNDGNHAMTSVVGSLSLGQGWHPFKLNYMQTLPTNLGLTLEMSIDGGTTYTIVPEDQLKYSVTE